MVYLLLFLSGAAALVYEMAWSRQLGLLLGNTVHAAAVVLGAYFAGMALGYYIAGLFARGVRRPLAAYGAAELVVAGWAAVTPLILGSLKTPGIAALLNNPDPALQLATRVVLVFLVLLPATAAMGATLPFIAGHFSRDAAASDSRIALAYAFNTAGAVTGVLLATFVLILYAGVVASNWLAAAVSALCGVVAVALAYRTGAARTTEAAAEQETGSAALRPVPAAAPGVWYWLAGLSGAGLLALQVLYTKMFALVLHNSTYTFGVVVAVFLLALALGGWLIARWGWKFSAEQFLPLACGAGPLLVLAGVLFFQRYTRLGYYTPGQGFGGYILGVLALSAFVIVPGVLLLATILPWTWRRLAGVSRSGAVGRLTAINTLSASAGALGASFVLLPLTGLWPGVVLVCAAYWVTALWLAWRRNAFGRFRVTVGALLIPLVAAAVLVQVPLSRVPADAQVIYACETPYGYIDVLEKDNGELWLRQNNHYTLGATYGADSELRQGHIPLLLHEEPADVCFLGLATGITASSALMHPEVQHVTAVELIPEVVEAAGLFGEYNSGITSRQDVEIVVNDARHFLYATGRRFDAIISDLFVPWHSQTGYLYTVEHYRAAQQRLKPGGLFCQWLPLYQVSATELELIANSFAEVFPVVTMWRGEFSGDTPLLALVGSEAPLELNAAYAQYRISRLPDPPGGPDPVLQRSRDLIDLYMGDWHRQPGAPLNSDEHPRVEFLAPISQRNKQKLTGEALELYYDSVVFGLQTEYLFLTNTSPSDSRPGDNRSRQLGDG